MFSLKTAEESYYTEPYQPYVYCGKCFGCIKEGNYHTRYFAEGKEVGFKLYVRLVCPVNPDHNGRWMYHCKRPLRFRINKILRRLINKK